MGLQVELRDQFAMCCSDVDIAAIIPPVEYRYELHNLLVSVGLRAEAESEKILPPTHEEMMKLRIWARYKYAEAMMLYRGWGTE